jgi:hypothetical protein
MKAYQIKRSSMRSKTQKIRGPCGRGFLEGVLAGMPEEVDEETLRVRFEGDWRSR